MAQIVKSDARQFRSLKSWIEIASCNTAWMNVRVVLVSKDKIIRFRSFRPVFVKLQLGNY